MPCFSSFVESLVWNSLVKGRVSLELDFGLGCDIKRDRLSKIVGVPLDYKLVQWTFLKFVPSSPFSNLTTEVVEYALLTKRLIIIANLLRENHRFNSISIVSIDRKEGEVELRIWFVKVLILDCIRANFLSIRVSKEGENHSADNKLAMLHSLLVESLNEHRLYLDLSV